MTVLVVWLASAAFGGSTLASPMAVAAWPVVMDFDFCWGVPTCAYTVPGDEAFTVFDDGTFAVSDGNTGTWTFSGRTRKVRLRFDGTSTIYTGTLLNGCVNDGVMTIQGARAGSWSGCVR